MRARSRAPAPRRRSRVRLVGGGVIVGVVGGLVAATALSLYGASVGFGTRKAFALGALALGIGAIGWSGYAFVDSGRLRRGNTVGIDSRDGTSGRRAMARVAGFGGGIMLGATALEAVL